MVHRSRNFRSKKPRAGDLVDGFPAQREVFLYAGDAAARNRPVRTTIISASATKPIDT